MMDSIMRLYPAPQPPRKCIYQHPAFTMDLHGFSYREAEKKMNWLLEYSAEKPEQTFQIITGIGSGVLRTLVKKTLRRWENQKKIRKWKEKKNDLAHNNETGVFLFIR